MRRSVVSSRFAFPEADGPTTEDAQPLDNARETSVPTPPRPCRDRLRDDEADLSETERQFLDYLVDAALDALRGNSSEGE